MQITEGALNGGLRRGSEFLPGHSFTPVGEECGRGQVTSPRGLCPLLSSLGVWLVQASVQ